MLAGRKPPLKLLLIPAELDGGIWPGLDDHAQVDLFYFRRPEQSLNARSGSIELATCQAQASETASRRYDYVLGRANALAWLPVFRLAGLDTPFAVTPNFNHVAPYDAYVLALAGQFARPGDLLFTGSRSAQRPFAGFGFEALGHHATGVPLQEFRPLPAEHRRQTRARLGIPDQAPLLLYTGRLSPDKSVAELIGVHRRVKQALGISHLVISSWVEQPEYARHCHELGRMVGDVLFVNSPPRPELVEQYNSADLFALFGVSVHDTFGFSPLEAMACGTPPVVPCYDGFAENIPASAGLLCPTRGDPAARGCDIDDFADRVIALLQDQPRRRSMRAAGLEAIRRFDRASSLQRFVDTLADRAQAAASAAAAPPPAAWRCAGLPPAFAEMASNLEGHDLRALVAGLLRTKQHQLQASAEQVRRFRRFWFADFFPERPGEPPLASVA
jgi:glycosyltransferase involved in cell wall biosynthesis